MEEGKGRWWSWCVATTLGWTTAVRWWVDGGWCRREGEVGFPFGVHKFLLRTGRTLRTGNCGTSARARSFCRHYFSVRELPLSARTAILVMRTMRAWRPSILDTSKIQQTCHANRLDMTGEERRRVLILRLYFYYYWFYYIT